MGIVGLLAAALAELLPEVTPGNCSVARWGFVGTVLGASAKTGISLSAMKIVVGSFGPEVNNIGRQKVSARFGNTVRKTETAKLVAYSFENGKIPAVAAAADLLVVAAMVWIAGVVA